MSTPVRVRVRMYQVGFGDCFLLSLEYDDPLPDGRSERHLLIDYGSTHSPQDGRARGRMRDVAKLIAKHTGGQLDLVVLSHRHKDHLLGFSDDTGARTIRELAPKLVLRPWSEDPDLDPDASGPATPPPRDHPDDPDDSEPVGAASRRFATRLIETQQAVGRLASRPGLDAGLKSAAEEHLKNADAIALLNELSGQGRGRYLFAGADPDLGDTVPGLTMTVLGPPTIDQDPRVRKQVEDDDQFWLDALHTSLVAAASGAGDEHRPQHNVPISPGPVRWLVDQLGDQKTHSTARLVRQLDDALNNTSLILLLEIGGLSLLFPGDAQIENWQFTLDRFKKEPELEQKLTAIDLYKVGHHGSRNATPRSLHALWLARPDTLPRLTALMSTRPHVHGDTAATAVPRETLLTALREVADLISTDDLDDGQAFVEVVADATGGPFRRVAVKP